MGTLGVVQALLLYIQGERNPMYVATRRRAGIPLGPIWGQWQGCLFVAVLILVTTFAYIEDQFASGAISRAALGTLLLAVAGGVLSLSWIVPLAALSCRGIAHERASRIWDILRVTPYPTETILLANAAASVQPVWQITVGVIFVTSLLGICIAGPITVVIALQRGIPLIGGVLFMAACMIGIVAEREQEIALAVLIGLAAGLLTDSRQIASLFGLVGGLVFRLFQTLLTLGLILILEPLASPYFALLNAASGTATLIAAVPGFASLAIVLALIGAREGLIRLLFAWAVRRTQEG